MAGTTEQKIARVEADLGERFELKDLGDTNLRLVACSICLDGLDTILRLQLARLPGFAPILQQNTGLRSSASSGT